jgi:putative SOS response-associated peptidase YedK
MCGRFVSASPPDELARYFGAEPPTGEPLAANYNVAPTTEVYAVVEEHTPPDRRPDGAADDGAPHRRLERFRWGLVPPWAEDLRAGARMINARMETVATRNAFRSAFRRRRCIVPADGFYEWTTVPGRKQRQPWYIHRPDGEPYAFAGLWELWRPGHDNGPWVRTCTVLTAAANPVMARIHDRMPVVLPPGTWERWLDPDLHDADELLHLLQPTPASLVAFHAVSTDVNRVANRGPHLLDEVPGVALDGPTS